MRNPSLKKIGLALAISASTLGLAACGSTQVQRVDSDQEIALTDKWNDEDSRLVAEKMVKDMLSFPWVADHNRRSDRRPAIIVQSIRNKSHEHISPETFINDLKRAILRSGTADFVASNNVRQEVRAERLDQEVNSSMDTQAAIGEETGANYALSGSINSFVDELDGKRVTSYQVDLRLIDMSSNREVWNGQEKIKKFQKKSRFGF